nr:unnamed protein product [Callosobruchus chinensis]
MSVSLLKKPQMHFGAITFFAKQHKDDVCGSNGLPLTPNSIIIYGKAQILKTIVNPYLCRYLDIIRGKHERTIVVSQYCGKALSSLIEKTEFSIDDIRRIAYQILQGLMELHSRNIVHHNLSSENILIENGNIKLFNYGLYYMTDNGKLVSFPVIQLLYTAPEVYLEQFKESIVNPKVDIWSLGIILAELTLNKLLWSSLILGQRIRKVLSLLQSSTSVFERIAREHNCYDRYQAIPADLKEVIEACLNIYPQDRPTAAELLKKEIFSQFQKRREQWLAAVSRKGISRKSIVFVCEDHFDVKRAASNLFSRGISLIAEHLEHLIASPPKKKILHFLPLPFKADYRQVQYIIDCLEISIEKPSDPIKQALTWSKFKNKNSLKYLLSYTPNGTISYISRGFGGRFSDAEIIEKSGFLETLEPNTVLVSVRDSEQISYFVSTKNCKLLSIPSNISNSKLSEPEKRLMVHVEHVVNRIRKFRLLSGNCHINSELIHHMNDIILIACGLLNIQQTDMMSLLKTYEIFTISELYYWWQLTGGDVLQELKRQGLIRLVLIEGTILGQDRNPATLYDPKIVEMPMETLYERFKNIPFACYYPLIQTKSEIIARSEPEPYDATGLPLVIKEKDPEYQFHRVILLRRLLQGYPFTKDLIVKEAEKDIPPLLRGDIWTALLNVRGDYERQYIKIDKVTPTPTDRQIEVDIPRCHQYNELLSSMEGHKKLKRILKAWVNENAQYAFACLSKFVPKYLHNFFLKDNSAVIEEYLAKFSQLIAFHDPVLANHLYEINFYPQLFAIPWFLTLFSHVFPLHKILHLWDKVLLGNSSFSLHIGLSVLTQLRDRLLNSGFNECILLFSDLPEVDIEKSVILSAETFQKTPGSITHREYENEEFKRSGELDISGVTLQDLKKERCPRISASDLLDLVRNSPQKVLVVDIRNITQFNRCSVRESINIPFSSVLFSEVKIESIGQHSGLLKENQDRTVVVVGDEETDLEVFPTFLLKCNVKKVCVLHGGFNILLPISPTILASQNHIS